MPTNKVKTRNMEVSAVSINSINPIPRMRFGGLATGLDTQYMVSELMRVENMKVDKLRQNLQLVEWRQDQYRSITDRLTAFRRDFFDPVRPSNYLMSPATFNTFQATSADSAVISATAQSGAAVGVNTIDRITSLAQAARATGTKAVSPSLEGQAVFQQIEVEEGQFVDHLDLSGQSFTLEVDGVARTILEELS